MSLDPLPIIIIICMVGILVGIGTYNNNRDKKIYNRGKQ